MQTRVAQVQQKYNFHLFRSPKQQFYINSDKKTEPLKNFFKAAPCSLSTLRCDRSGRPAGGAVSTHLGNLISHCDKSLDSHLTLIKTSPDLSRVHTAFITGFTRALAPSCLLTGAQGDASQADFPTVIRKSINASHNRERSRNPCDSNRIETKGQVF